MTHKQTTEQIRFRKSLLVLSAVILPYILVYFHRVAPAVVVDPIMTDFGIEASTVGLLASTYFLVYTFLQVPAGILSDWLGPRITISAGTAVAALGSLLFGMAPSIEWAFVGRFLVGAGVSFIFVPILRLHTTWFEPRHFATLSGLTLFIGNLGALLASYPLAALSDLAGWRSAFYLTGMAGLVAAVLALIFIKDSPANVDLPLPAGAPRSTRATFRSATMGMVGVMRQPVNWLPFLIFAGLYGTIMGFQGAWGSAFLQDVYGLEPVKASTLLFAMGLGMLVGCPSAGWLADRTGRLRLVFASGMALFLLLLLALRLWPDLALPVAMPVLWILHFCLGLTASVFILTWPMARSLNDPQAAGSATGFSNMGGFLGGAIIPALFGAVLEGHQTEQLSAQGRAVFEAAGYEKGFLIFFVATAMSLLLLLLMPGRKDKAPSP